MLRILTSLAYIFSSSSFATIRGYPCESSPCQPRFQGQGKGPGNEIVSMFVPLWCIIISLVFFYFSLLLFTGFLQLQGYVVSVQKAQSTVIALLR